MIAAKARNAAFDLLVVLLFSLNLISVLFAAVLGGASGTDSFTTALQYVLTPLLIGSAILSVFLSPGALNRNLLVGYDRIIVYGFAVFLAMNLSMIMNGYGQSQLKPLYFLGVNVFMFWALTIQKSDVTLLPLLRWILIFWALPPLILAAIAPGMSSILFTEVDGTFRGFAESRIGYGLWAGLLLILLWSNPTFPCRKILLAAVTGAIVFSQSRAALGALFVSFAYLYIALYRGSYWKVIGGICLLGAALAASLVVWQGGGREDLLDIFTFSRLIVLKEYLDFIQSHFWFGFGGYGGITIPGGNEPSEAHNLLIQALADYGVIFTIVYFAYLWRIFTDLENPAAKMVFIFLITYSMMQPAVIPGLMSTPITVVFFLVMMLLEREEEVPARAAVPRQVLSAPT